MPAVGVYCAVCALIRKLELVSHKTSTQTLKVALVQNFQGFIILRVVFFFFFAEMATTRNNILERESSIDSVAANQKATSMVDFGKRNTNLSAPFNFTQKPYHHSQLTFNRTN